MTDNTESTDDEEVIEVDADEKETVEAELLGDESDDEDVTHFVEQNEDGNWEIDREDLRERIHEEYGDDIRTMVEEDDELTLDEDY